MFQSRKKLTLKYFDDKKWKSKRKFKVFLEKYFDTKS